MRSLFTTMCTLLLCAAFSIAAIAQQPDAPADSGDKPSGKKKTSVFTMGEIVVTERAIANIEQITLTTDINDKDITERGDKTLGDALRMVPGTNVYLSNKGCTVFDLWGLQHSKVAILVDGLPFEDVYGGGGGDISKIPMHGVSNIIVNRGISSALYGTMGLIGSINVISKKPEAMFTQINAEYGQHDNYSMGIAHGAPVGNLYYMVTAGYTNSSGYEISQRLTRERREGWFNKLVQYKMYFPTLTVDDIKLDAADRYLNDSGRWSENTYQKYYASLKIGYNVTKEIEVGVSSNYVLNQQHSSYFMSNTTLSFTPVSNQNTGQWYRGGAPFNAASYQTDSSSAMFRNNVFVWPEDSRYSVMPYLKMDYGDFMLRANMFYVHAVNKTEAFANQQYATNQFPTSQYYWSPTPLPAKWSSIQRSFTSTWIDTSYGINIQPSYKFAKWNRLSGAIMVRNDMHDEREQALYDDETENLSATQKYWWINGMEEYETKQMEAMYLTVAVEDEMKFDTPAGNLALTFGISYDAMDLRKFQAVTTDSAIMFNRLDNIDLPDDRGTTWKTATRDSYNPVAGLLYEPVKDFVKLRAAYASKTEFPNLGVYASNQTAHIDYNVKPEKATNMSGGLELLFLKNTISLRGDYFYTQFKDKIERILDPTISSNRHYRNLSSVVIQGYEAAARVTLPKVVDFMTNDLNFTYVHLHTINYDESYISKGDRIEKTPEHQYMAELRTKFTSGTGINIWGQHTVNQMVYVMNGVPPSGTNNKYTTSWYTKAYLHDPFFLNIRISQKIMENFEVYVMCKNVLDDYQADALNPGPGRMFYFGGSGEF